MTVLLTHTTQATGTDAGNGEIRKAEWNEAHTLTAATRTVLARLAGTDGAVEEAVIATDANMRAGTTDAIVMADTLRTAAVAVALTDGSSITPDFDAGRIFSVTLGGNRTLENPTNQAAGQSGVVIVRQDGTGSRTLSYGTNWKFAGGAPTLTTTANAIDAISYYVEASGTILAAILTDLK
jgi:hypothetical protein